VHRIWGAREGWYEYPRYLFVNNSADILRLCGQTLDQLGVAWRFSKPNTISVASREAVARPTREGEPTWDGYRGIAGARKA
jgi:hypothetical protein